MSNGSPDAGFDGSTVSADPYQFTDVQIAELSTFPNWPPRQARTRLKDDEDSIEPSWKAHGLTLDEYEILFFRFKGLCHICEEWKVRVVDHDHSCCPRISCGKCVRGLLCRGCNGLIGGSHDSVTALRTLAERFSPRSGLYLRGATYLESYAELRAQGLRVSGVSEERAAERAGDMLERALKAANGHDRFTCARQYLLTGKQEHLSRFGLTLSDIEYELAVLQGSADLAVLA